MLHLYQNDEGETVAADTLDQAARFHDCELGGEPEPLPGWEQIDDDAMVPIGIEPDGPGDEWITEKKLAREWAAEYDVPTLAASTYA